MSPAPEPTSTAAPSRVAVVTGAAGTIGALVVARLVGTGATVVAADIDEGGEKTLRFSWSSQHLVLRSCEDHGRFGGA